MKKGVAICKKEWYNNEVAWGKHKQQKGLKTQKKAFKSNERDFKKLFKNFEKSVDKRKWMWYNNSHTVERGSVRTDKKLSKKCVGPWKLNNEKIVKKPVMTLRKAQRITVRCTLKSIRNYGYSQWHIRQWAIKALKLIVSESLIYKF